ncbi:MAG: hypothetical protein JXA01_09190 [Dehalococcoidia bacterium]|nr:hypothetical protein [Dehalococcoidia bacterium]
MDIQEFLANLTRVIGANSPIVGASLFALCFIGELIAINIPYFVETTLMLAGYSTLNGGYAYYNLLIIMLMTLTARFSGTLIIYFVTRRGGGKLIEKTSNLIRKHVSYTSVINRMTSSVNLLSPFSIAAGRLVGLRYPLTLIMAAQGRLKTLLVGTVFASIVYDSVYIVAGALVGATTNLEPFQVMIYFLVGITLVYVILYMVQYLRQRRLR